MTRSAHSDRGPALITGAGSGLGLRLAELLLARAQPVGALDRTFGTTALERLGSAALVGGVEFAHAQADVREEGEVVAAVADLAGAVGAPRVAINAAGVLDARPFCDLDAEAFRRVVDINLIGSRNVAFAAFPYLAGGGRLTLIASLAGLFGTYAYSAYGASKFGVVGLAEVLRIEGKDTGVRVSVVCPPEIETPMATAERRTMHAATRAMKSMAGTLPLERACREILAGIDAGDYLIIPGRRARVLRVANKLLPAALGHRMVDMTVARARRAAG